MKIVYISNSYIPSREANSMNVMNMCNAYVELGHEVFLFIPKTNVGIEKHVDNIHEFYGVSKEIVIVPLPYPNIVGKPYIYSFFIMKELKKVKPDLVIGRFIHGMYVSTRLGFPSVFDSHNLISNSGKLAEYIFKRMLKEKALRLITTNSSALRNIYIDNYRISDSKIKVAHNGALVFSSDKISDPVFEDKKVVGYFGHLYEGRGIEIILKLAETFPYLFFLIVGGSDNDVEKWRDKTSNVPNILFKGFVEPSDIYLYRNRCDILLAPYQKKVVVARSGNDTSKFMNPIKLFEYMSAGKPIISSNMEPIKEILNKNNAVLVEADDQKSWEEALSRIIDDTNFANQIASNAKNDFLNHYTWTIRAKKLLS